MKSVTVELDAVKRSSSYTWNERIALSLYSVNLTWHRGSFNRAARRVRRVHIVSIGYMKIMLYIYSLKVGASTPLDTARKLVAMHPRL